jgi:predicted acylesterase/phospholipase RssA
MDDINWKPRVLVIGPGGVKGLMILGFLSYIEDLKILDQVDTYCGVSIGAVISLLIIAGYKIREIVGVASKIDIFKDITNVNNIKKIIKHKGLLSNEPVRQTLTNLMLNKMGCVPTLYDLYMKTGKALITTTLNITDEITEYIGPFTHGQVSCVDAVMYSMNVPFLYYQLIDKAGKNYVDGILASPYPVDHFDNNTTPILGIYIKTIYGTNNANLDFSSYMHKIYETAMNQRVINIVNKSSNFCKHVSLSTKQIDSIGINISIEDRAQMLVDGYNEGKQFINNLNNPTIVKNCQLYQYPPYYLFDTNI